jgi:hypothetical protein
MAIMNVFSVCEIENRKIMYQVLADRYAWGEDVSRSCRGIWRSSQPSRGSSVMRPCLLRPCIERWYSPYTGNIQVQNSCSMGRSTSLNE